MPHDKTSGTHIQWDFDLSTGVQAGSEAQWIECLLRNDVWKVHSSSRKARWEPSQTNLSKVLGIPHHSTEPAHIMGTLSCVWIYLRGASSDEVYLVRFSEMLIFLNLFLVNKRLFEEQQNG